MTRFFISVLNSLGQYIEHGAVEVFNRDEGTYPQHFRLLETDRPTAVELWPSDLNKALKIGIKVPAAPGINGNVLNLSHEVVRKVDAPIHVVFRLPNCAGRHFFSGQGRPVDGYEHPQAQKANPDPPPDKSVPVDKIEIACRTVAFTIEDDGQLPAEASHVFQLSQDVVDVLTNPILVDPGQSMSLEVPQGSTTCKARVWRADGNGDPIPATDKRYLMWNRETEGATLLIAPPPRLPVKTFHTKRIAPPGYTIQYQWASTNTSVQHDDSRVPHIYKNHQGDRQLSALARTYWEECHAHAKREVLKLHPDATNFRVRALVSNPNREFVLREVSGNYTWHAFHADGSALPSSRIRADLPIDGIIAEWVLEG